MSQAAATPTLSEALAAPLNLVAEAGDRSVILHWEAPVNQAPVGYNLYRQTDPAGGWLRIHPSLLSIQSASDTSVTNGGTYFYTVRAVNADQTESAGSNLKAVVPRPFPSDAAFLEYVERAAFEYFWYEANPDNGLIRDRSEASSFCSIAAVGFGLTALGIGVDHGWISREQAADRVFRTLRTFWESPQGTNAAGTIGYQGWFYHFLDMKTATRSSGCELSSVDTAWLLAGIIYAREYFDRDAPVEASIRSRANAILNRVDWSWMAHGGDALRHGWMPESGFLAHRWIGYNEAMMLYVLGLGAAHAPLPRSQWQTWTSGYHWETNAGLAYVSFPPLFGHQYSHCWIDFRGQADAFMRAHRSTYFENSRRATLAQRLYCQENPGHFAGYGNDVWGLTACDGPDLPPRFLGYAARGGPPAFNDDGTIAPTACASSLPFTPKESLAALRSLYERFRTRLWTGYGFCDAFNLSADWQDPDVLGIDQGPILLMLENARSGRVWQFFMRAPEIHRGLAAAGFRPCDFP